MGHNDSLDEELYNRIEEHLEKGSFEKGSPEYGIALKVAQEGIESLSMKQRALYETVSVPILSQPLNDDEEMQDALHQDWESEAGS